MVMKKYGWWFWLWIKIWINKMKCFFGANVVFKSGVRSTCSVANEAKLAGEVGAFGVEEELSICMSIYVHVAQLSWLAIQSAWSVLAGHLEVISSTDVGLNRFRPQFFSARPFFFACVRDHWSKTSWRWLVLGQRAFFVSPWRTPEVSGINREAGFRGEDWTVIYNPPKR